MLNSLAQPETRMGYWWGRGRKGLAERTV